MAHIMYYIFLLNFVSHSYPVDAWGVFFFKMDGWMDNLDGAFFAGYQFRLFHFSLLYYFTIFGFVMYRMGGLVRVGVIFLFYFLFHSLHFPTCSGWCFAFRLGYLEFIILTYQYYLSTSIHETFFLFSFFQ